MACESGMVVYLGKFGFFCVIINSFTDICVKNLINVVKNTQLDIFSL